MLAFFYPFICGARGAQPTYVRLGNLGMTQWSRPTMCLLLWLWCSICLHTCHTESSCLIIAAAQQCSGPLGFVCIHLWHLGGATYVWASRTMAFVQCWHYVTGDATVCTLLWLWCGVCLGARHTESSCLMESSGTAVQWALGFCMYSSHLGGATYVWIICAIPAAAGDGHEAVGLC